MVGETAGGPLANAAALRAALELSRRLAALDDFGALIATLPGDLSGLVSFDDLTLTLRDVHAQGLARYALDASSRTLAEQRGPNGADALEVFALERGRLFTTSRPDPEAPDPTDLLARTGMASLCALPLAARERRLGALVLGSRRAHAYPPEDLELLGLLADEIAAAIEHAASRSRLAAAVSTLERSREREELMQAVGSSILSVLELPELLHSVSANTRKVIGCDAVGVALIDDEAEGARVLAVEFPETRGVVKEGLVLPIIGTPLEKVLRSGQPGSIGIVDPLGIAAAEGIAGNWALPLVSRGRTLGVLIAARRGHATFTDEDKELLGQIAPLVAIALDNALAYRQIADLNRQLAQEKLYLEDEIRFEGLFEQIVGRSAPLRHVLKQIETVATTDSTVLIEGETGSGKELIARAIHDLGARKSKTFVKLNCAAIPTGLLESELFGHKRGAFTGAVADRIGRFELANGGTVFLDEIGEIPLELQPKLLRVLQEREFERIGSSYTLRTDARLVAATNRDLSAMVEDNAFRADLFYRLNVFPIRVPPLRERREDIPLLVRHFAKQLGRKMNRVVETIPGEAMEALTRYDWPGNVRELQNLIERALIVSTGPVLRVPLEELSKRVSAPKPSGPAGTLEAADRAHILAALEESGWVLGGPNGAAERLGLKRSTLQFRMKKLGITRPGSQ